MYVYETFIKWVDGSEGAEAPDTRTSALTMSDRDDALPPTLTCITPTPTRLNTIPFLGVNFT